MSKTLEEMVAQSSLEELRRYYITMLRDVSDDEVRIDEMAAMVLSKEFLEGDTYYVPSKLGIVEEVIQQLQEARETITKLENQLVFMTAERDAVVSEFQHLVEENIKLQQMIIMLTPKQDE